MIFTQTQAFVYKWTHLPTLRWYIGSRTAQGCCPADGYICSSRQVLPLIESAGSEWTRTVVATGEPADMLELETVILETVDARNDPRSYNQHNGDGRFTTAGTVAWNKGLKQPRGTPSWNSGKVCPQISAGKLGKPAHNKGKPSPLKGRPNGRKGIANPKIVCRLHDQKEMAINTFTQWCELQDNPTKKQAIADNISKALTGRKQSPEWIEKRAQATRGKPNIAASLALKGQTKPRVVSRLIDRKPMTISNFVQWCELKDRQARGVVHPNKGKSKSVEAIAKRTATRLQNKLAKTKGA